MVSKIVDVAPGAAGERPLPRGESMEVVVVGLGYVGAVTAACLADRGHVVTGVDVDPLKVEEMDRGRSPVVEPRLGELISSTRSSGALSVTTELLDVASRSDVIIVCVGTPDRSDGTVDLSHIERVSVEIGRALKNADRFTVVVFRSTVPPGTVDRRLGRSSKRRAAGALALTSVSRWRPSFSAKAAAFKTSSSRRLRSSACKINGPLASSSTSSAGRSILHMLFQSKRPSR